MPEHCRVKICGITRIEDALYAESLGTHAIGFVLVPQSKRYIEPAKARAIAAELGPFVVRVGLFLNAEARDVAAAIAQMPGLLPQFHGTESAAYCEQFGVPYIKAIGAIDGRSDEQLLDQYRHAQSFLYDSHAPGEVGGTGKAFDWTTLPSEPVRALVLAGGLHADNVAEAIATVRPHAVDVSSGVESSPGIKDHGKLARFMAAVKVANHHASTAS